MPEATTAPAVGAAATAHPRRGGHVLADALAALGADVVFGVPGIHALAAWEGMRETPLRPVPSRTELAAAFAADGYARTSRRPAPVLLSTGPGALNSLTGIMEACSSHVPVVAIASHIPQEFIGQGRGYLHDIPNQRACFDDLVKWAGRATCVEAIPQLLAQAWAAALTPPSGPVLLEIPEDVLRAETDLVVGALEAPLPPPVAPAAEQLAAAAELLAAAERPVIWCGGGVLRGDATAQLRALAERLDAPVATTYMGQGGFPASHPLSLGAACLEAPVQGALAQADVVLAVGTELGFEITRHYELQFSGQLIQVDAAAERIGATYPALGLVGDAAATLQGLLAALGEQPAAAAAAAAGEGARRAAAVRDELAALLDTRDAEVERGLLRTIREVAGPGTPIAWDMTILAYSGSAHYLVEEPDTFLYSSGSGTLGYAWPAAIGAALAAERPSLAIHGDGGVMYCLVELAVAKQHGIPAKLLIVDDGGYGILRVFQGEDYGATTDVELGRPDFVALAESFGVFARTTDVERFGEDLAAVMAADGPAVLVLPATLKMI